MNALQHKVAVVNTKPSCRATFSNISEQKNPIAVLKAQEIALLVSIKNEANLFVEKITLISTYEKSWFTVSFSTSENICKLILPVKIPVL